MKTIKIGDIRPFDIMLEGSTSKLSKTIQAVIKEPISHSGIFFTIVDILGATLYIHESDRFGLRNTNFQNHYANSKYNIYVARLKGITPTVVRDNNLVHFAVETAGHKGYDFMNLLVHQPIKMLWKWLFNKELWVGRKNQSAEGRFICSERTAYVLNKFFKVEPTWWKISTDYFMDNDKYELFKLEM